MHGALLLLAILELPGGLRMQLPQEVCAIIDARGDVELHKGTDKTSVAWVVENESSLCPSGEQRCIEGDRHIANVRAGSHNYAVVAKSSELLDVITIHDAMVERAWTDNRCSFEPLLTAVHSTGGVAAFIRSVTIWSDGEVIDSEEHHERLTPAELKFIRRIAGEKKFVEALTSATAVNDAEIPGVSLATQDGIGNFHFEDVQTIETPDELRTIITDGTPRVVRETLARIDPLIARHFGERYDHWMKLRETKPSVEVFTKPR